MNDILLVEDNEELAELIMAFLRRDGYTVCWVTTGKGAVSYMENHSVRLMLLDIMLPEMDGFAVCRAVRKQHNLPILIMSARSGREDKLSGYELGADDYVEKPVDGEILSAKVRALMQRAYGSQQKGPLVSGDRSAAIEARRDRAILEQSLKKIITALSTALPSDGCRTKHKSFRWIKATLFVPD